MVTESGSRVLCGGSDRRRLENMATNRWHTVYAGRQFSYRLYRDGKPNPGCHKLANHQG
jgi:hypothetical protein